MNLTSENINDWRKELDRLYQDQNGESNISSKVFTDDSDLLFNYKGLTPQDLINDEIGDEEE
jgi:hypothetical protein